MSVKPFKQTSRGGLWMGFCPHRNRSFFIFRQVMALGSSVSSLYEMFRYLRLLESWAISLGSLFKLFLQTSSTRKCFNSNSDLGRETKSLDLTSNLSRNCVLMNYWNQDCTFHTIQTLICRNAKFFLKSTRPIWNGICVFGNKINDFLECHLMLRWPQKKHSSYDSLFWCVTKLVIKMYSIALYD